MFARRRLLQLGMGAAAVGTAAACGSSDGSSGGSTVVGPDSRAVDRYAAQLRKRFPNGRTVSQTLTAAPTQLDLAGSDTTAWVYNGQLPGPTLRANVGDRVRVRLSNQLPEPSTIHWHGLAIRNDMDGVPNVTQEPVAAGSAYDYEFIPPHPGTFWYHSHGHLQRGRGLYGALLIDDPADPGDYDVEFTVVLADWLTQRTPEQVFDSLRGGMKGMSMDMGHMSGHGGEKGSPVLGGDAGDVRYPVYLCNGRGPDDPVVFQARPGQRARLRIINAAEDTTFRVALGGHRLTVTGSDGFAVTPTGTSSVLIGMGERYDAMVTLNDGVFPLVASAEGKGDRAFAVVRTSSGATPSPTAELDELAGRPLTVADLSSVPDVRLAAKPPEQTLRARLGGGMKRFDWTINGRAYPDYEPLTVQRGRRVRLVYTNRTMMYHPVHLHGHTFQVATGNGTGPRKDTAIVLPGQSITADFDTDNPGQWFTHCHNEYHLAAGMATVVSYRR